MTRRLKRLRDFDISLQIRNPNFIRPPRDGQRNWLLNTALDEFAHHLIHLNAVAQKFVPGADASLQPDHWTEDDPADEQIMEEWQRPIMQAMAVIVTETHGDVLEIGFGRGVSAEMIQQRGVASHTIVEVSDAIIGRFQRWRSHYPDRDIRVIHGRWQDVVDQMGRYDGVFFHTYPMSEDEYLEQVVRSVTFAGHFFPTAARVLRPGGIFTYLTNEIDSFSRAHQRLLFDHFSEVTLRVVDNLNLPQDVHDAWWADSMVVVKAVK